jgi:NAD(P)-dependent dehydrogenase (short-subunit alcohol dehydrogenase family)
MTSASELSDATVAISGASGGIGSAIAGRFAQAGAQLVLIDRDEAGLAVVSARYAGSRMVRCDQRKHEDIERAVREAGEVDVFINNAGIIIRKPVIEMTADEISDVLAVNLDGAIRMATGIGRGMVARGRGTVLNMSSQHAFIGARDRAVYAATKAALAQFTKSTAVEWAPRGVRVIGLAPGPVESPMTAGALKSEDYRRDVLARMPIGRLLTTAEMAEIAFQLCRPALGAIVGQTIIADGGSSLT